MWYGVDMPSPTTTFRLTDRDRGKLDRLADELLCSRTDVVRHGIATLLRTPELRSQIKAEHLALAFLNRLRSARGDRATLGFRIGFDDPKPTIDDSPVDPDELAVVVRYENDFAFVDLVDPTTGVGIRNAYWTEANDTKDVRLPLHSLGLYIRVTPTSEPQSQRLPDGRTVVTIEEDEGPVKHVVLAADGTSSLLHDEQQAFLVNRGRSS